MSPEIETRTKQLMAVYKSDFTGVKEKEAKVTSTSIEMLKHEMTRRLAADEKYAQAKERLERLNVDMFYIQYGDYFSQTCNFLRQKLIKETKAAKGRLKRQIRKEKKEAGRENVEDGPSQVSQPGPRDETDENTATDSGLSPLSPSQEDEERAEAVKTFVSDRWPNIDYTLSSEEKALSGWSSKGWNGPPPMTPMIDILKSLTKDKSFVTYAQARVSISNYSTRNQFTHSHIAIMMKENSTINAAVRVQEDLRNLPDMTCVDRETIAATEAAIFATVGMFFKEFKYDKSTGSVYSAVPWPKTKEGRFLRNLDEAEIGYISLDDEEEGGDEDYL
ncbi:hypothetical protein F4781DRAFT_445523 [Annulohypoxylon bovei var. microspora]|nr:hypothetical protein F4781DRAFT_445523 [Annulohypoxylon bovei var. microspora]